jgi:hypothetical protein
LLSDLATDSRTLHRRTETSDSSAAALSHERALLLREARHVDASSERLYKRESRSHRLLR